MPLQRIEHTGFRLEPLCRADEPLFTALFGCAEVMQQIGPVLNQAEAAELFNKVLSAAEDQGYCYWVVWNNAGQNVGLAALTPQQPGCAEFGLMLFPQFFFNGYSVPVLSGLINYGFTLLGLDAVVAKHRISTTAAPGLLKRLGVNYESSSDGYQHWRLTKTAWGLLAQQPPYASTDRTENLNDNR